MTMSNRLRTAQRSGHQPPRRDRLLRRSAYEQRGDDSIVAPRQQAFVAAALYASFYAWREARFRFSSFSGLMPLYTR